MEEFLKFFDDKVRDFPMHLEIYYSQIMDWCIDIYKGDRDHAILHVQDNDIEYCFARAYVELKDWLIDNNGGY